MILINRIKRTILLAAILAGSLYIQTARGQHDGHDLLTVKDRNGTVRLISTTPEWLVRRQEILDSMMAVMGHLPAEKGPRLHEYTVLGEESFDGIRRLRINFDGSDNDMVPAYLFIPVCIKKPVPGILCLHQTTSIGKGEPAGLGGNPNLHYALELARTGYVTLAPDYPNFGDYVFDPYSRGYLSATMKGIRNHIAAVDLLQSLPEVDPERIGCIGHSLGGHNSLFVAAFDTRIKAVVTSCGFTSFRKYYNGDLTGWSHKGYMPRIATVYGKDPSRMPFDFPGVLAAIAPRAVFINAPLRDSNFEISGVYECFNAAKEVFHLLRADENLQMTDPDSEHDFPPEAREKAYRFLGKQLMFNNK